jgi:hypothetical protein
MRGFPEVPIALIRPVLERYEPLFGPNNFLGSLPETCKEAGALVRQRMLGR